MSSSSSKPKSMSINIYSSNYDSQFRKGLHDFGLKFLISLRESFRHYNKYPILQKTEIELIDRIISQTINYGENKKENIQVITLGFMQRLGLNDVRLMEIVCKEISPTLHQLEEDEERRRESYAFTVATEISADNEDYASDFEDEDAEVVEEEEQEQLYSTNSQHANGRINPTNRISSSKWDKTNLSMVSTINEDEEYIDDTIPYDDEATTRVNRVIHDMKRTDDDTVELFIMSKAASPQKQSIPKVSNHEQEQTPLKVHPSVRHGFASNETSPINPSNNMIVNSSSKSTKSSVSVSSSKKFQHYKSITWIHEKKWVLGDKIGKGSFGEVFQGMSTETGQLFACKKMAVTGKQFEIDNLCEEIDLMKDLSHPNVVAYLGTYVDETNAIVYIFQVWVPGGSIQDLLKKFGPFHEDVVRSYTRQILHGLKYLHENNIVHRDIKGGNVLVDDTGFVKLADFGASRKFDLSGTQATTTIKGTPFFMAPEVLSENRYGRKGDIWAVGCTMIQMLTGQPPWKDQNLNNLVQLHILLSSWNRGPPPYSPSTPISQACSDCIALCFQKDASTRPFAFELLQTEFLYEEEDPILAIEQPPLNINAQLRRNSFTKGENFRNISDQHQSNLLDESDGGFISGIREQLGRAVSRSTQFESKVTTSKPKETRNDIVDFWICSSCHHENRIQTSTCSSCKTVRSQIKSNNPFQYGAVRVSKDIMKSHQSNSPLLVNTKLPRQSRVVISQVSQGNSGQKKRYENQSTNRDTEDITPMSEGSSDIEENHDNTTTPAMPNTKISWICLKCHKRNVPSANHCDQCATMKGKSGSRDVNVYVSMNK